MNSYEFCLEVIGEVQKCLDKNDNKQRILLLESALQNQFAGAQGAGLTCSARREALWIDFLTSESKRFSQNSIFRCIDADYYFDQHPISHKSIGWSGHGDLALSWSKNPEGGIHRTEFKAPVAIVSLKQKKGKWGLDQGYYMIPVDYLNEKISPNLKRNNKTDNLISSTLLYEALQLWRKRGLFIALPYLHESGKHIHLSDWEYGLLLPSRKTEK